MGAQAYTSNSDKIGEDPFLEIGPFQLGGFRMAAPVSAQNSTYGSIQTQHDSLHLLCEGGIFFLVLFENARSSSKWFISSSTPGHHWKYFHNFSDNLWNVLFEVRNFVKFMQGPHAATKRPYWNSVASIHFSPFTCCFRKFFRSSFRKPLVVRIARPTSLAIWHRGRSHCRPNRSGSPNRTHFASLDLKKHPDFLHTSQDFRRLFFWHFPVNSDQANFFFASLVQKLFRIASDPRGPNDQKNLIPIEILDLDRNFWSRSKISISTSRFPHKNRAAVGGSLENFILARNFQSRSKSRIFWSLGPLGFGGVRFESHRTSRLHRAIWATERKPIRGRSLGDSVLEFGGRHPCVSLIFSRARKPWSAHFELKHWNFQGWKCLIHGLHFTV